MSNCDNGIKTQMSDNGIMVAISEKKSIESLITQPNCVLLT